MAMDGGEETPRELLVIPDSITEEIDAQFDVLFTRLPDISHAPTRDGISIPVTTRDEAQFDREHALYHVATMLANPETAAETTQYIIDRHRNQPTPPHALYMYERILEQFGVEDEYDKAPIDFVLFVVSLADKEAEAEVQHELDDFQIHALEILNKSELNNESEMNDALNEQCTLPLRIAYVQASGDFESYSEAVLSNTSLSTMRAHDTFKQLPDTKAKHHDDRLLHHTSDPSKLSELMREGEFETPQGRDAARHLHDARFLVSLERGGINSLHWAVSHNKFLTSEAQEKAKILHDRLVLNDEELTPDKLREYIQRTGFLTPCGQAAAEALHDYQLFHIIRDNPTQLRYAIQHSLFQNQSGIGYEVAVQKLSIF